VQGNPDLAGSLDDFLGAVYALIQAKQHAFADRVGPIEISAVQKRAQKIAIGQVRIDGKWIAGFYFNNALFRTAAIYHRVLKIVVGEKAYVSVLVPKAKALYLQWTNTKLDTVHDQVNDNTDLGVGDGRYFTFPINPTGHQLLRALRGRKAIRRESGAYAALETTKQAYSAGAGGSCEVGA